MRQIYQLQLQRKPNLLRKSLIPIIYEQSLFVKKYDPQMFDVSSTS